MWTAREWIVPSSEHRRSAIPAFICRLVVIVFVLVLCRTGSADDNAAKVERLAEAIEQLEASTTRLETQVEVTTYRAKPGLDVKEWNDGDIHDKVELRWINSDGQVRVSRWRPASPTSPPELESESIWTGDVWYERRINGHMTIIQPEPELSFDTDALGYFNLLDWPSFGYKGSLSRILKTQRLLEIEESSESSRLRFALDGSGSWFMEVVLGTDGRVVIESIAMWRTAKTDAGDELESMRIELHLEDWRQRDGLYLPWRARRDNYSTLNPRNQPATGRVILRRLSARVGESATDGANDQIFAIGSPSEGELVSDTAFQVNYVVGKQVATLDGLPVELVRPSEASLGPKLAGFVASVTLKPTVASAVESPPKTIRNWRYWSPIVGASIAFVVGLAIISMCGGRLGVRPRSWKKLMIMCAAFVIIGAALGNVYMNTESATAPMLAGESNVTLGDMDFHSPRVVRSHDFHLSNVSGRTLRIEGITTSCGCTKAEPSSTVIAGGQELKVSAALTFASPGRRTERIWLNLGSDGIHELSMVGIARAPSTFYCGSKSLRLRDKATHELVLVESHMSDDRPPDPVIDSPSAVLTSWNGWKLVYSHSPEMSRPSRWQGVITAVLADGSQISEGRMTVKLDSTRVQSETISKARE